MAPDWLLYLLVPASLSFFAWKLYVMRKKSAHDSRTHHIITLDGFPLTHVPVALEREEAQRVAEDLRDTYTRTWAALDRIYGHTARPLPVHTIGCTMGVVRVDHLHVMWLVGSGKIYLRVQDGMYRWFALELHNVYRYLLHGMGGIYETQGDEDRSRATMAHQWILTNVKEKS